jgi:hypothetical protein
MKAKLLLIFVLTGVGFVQDVNTKPNRTNTHILSFILDFKKSGSSMLLKRCRLKNTSSCRQQRIQRRTYVCRAIETHRSDSYLVGGAILGKNPPETSMMTNAVQHPHRAVSAIDDAKNPIPTPRISPWPDGTATR